MRERARERESQRESERERESERVRESQRETWVVAVHLLVGKRLGPL